MFHRFVLDTLDVLGKTSRDLVTHLGGQFQSTFSRVMKDNVRLEDAHAILLFLGKTWEDVEKMYPTKPVEEAKRRRWG